MKSSGKQKESKKCGLGSSPEHGPGAINVSNVAENMPVANAIASRRLQQKVSRTLEVMLDNLMRWRLG